MLPSRIVNSDLSAVSCHWVSALNMKNPILTVVITKTDTAIMVCKKSVAAAIRADVFF